VYTLIISFFLAPIKNNAESFASRNSSPNNQNNNPGPDDFNIDDAEINDLNIQPVENVDFFNDIADPAPNLVANAEVQEYGAYDVPDPNVPLSSLIDVSPIQQSNDQNPNSFENFEQAFEQAIRLSLLNLEEEKKEEFEESKSETNLKSF